MNRLRRRPSHVESSIGQAEEQRWIGGWMVESGASNYLLFVICNTECVVQQNPGFFVIFGLSRDEVGLCYTFIVW